MSGAKIIRALEEAHAGDFARVTIAGEAWAKVKDIHADQQEIMRINNELRQALLDVRDMLHDSDVLISDRIVNADMRINLAVRS